MASSDRKDLFIQENTIFENLAELKGSKIAIEARWYLQTLLEDAPAKEPLVSALGGLPFALKKHLEADLQKWEKAGLSPVFVFDGLSLSGEDDVSLRSAKEASLAIDKGWELYSANIPDEAVAAFGSSGAVWAKDLYRFFQKILFDRKIEYEIAASSAAAHIFQMDKVIKRSDGSYTCDLSMGSTELLLYPLTTAIITKIDFEKGLFYGINRPQLLESLHVTEDVFIDTLLMTGTSFLPAFPPLKDPSLVSPQPYTIKDAVNMYRAASKNTIKLCDLWSDVLQKQEPDWLDKYRKARLAVKHSIHLQTEENSWKSAVAVNDVKMLTSDHHQYIGLQLPQELYHYMIHGGIGPRIMNWLAYLKMVVPPPFDGGNSDEFRQLVTVQLVPLRAQTIALYTSRLHRAFQHRPFSLDFWFDPNATVVVNHQSVQPPPDGLAATWTVTEKDFRLVFETQKLDPGTVKGALASLEDEEFAASTLSKASGKLLIKSSDEVLANTMWRFLHLRGYLNEKHRLTNWGKALLKTLKSLNPVHKQDEAALLAFELLRLDQLNTHHPHSDQIGAPQRGSEEEKSSCLLISRCASLLKLRHNEVGYTGPLSKNLLAYHSIVSTVRETDRDLIEAIVASMFLFADADRKLARDVGSDQARKRKNSDWRKIGFGLPFGTDIDVALGIAVKTWLDDHVKPGMSSEQKANLKQSYSKWLPHGEDFGGDLDMAFSFFEALFKGVETVKEAIPAPDFVVWAGAAKYLSERR